MECLKCTYEGNEGYTVMGLELEITWLYDMTNRKEVTDSVRQNNWINHFNEIKASLKYPYVGIAGECRKKKKMGQMRTLYRSTIGEDFYEINVTKYSPRVCP